MSPARPTKGEPREACGETVPNLKVSGQFVCDRPLGHSGQHSARITIGDDSNVRCLWRQQAVQP